MRPKTPLAFAALLAELFRATGSHEKQPLPRTVYCRCAGMDMALHFDDTIDPSNVHAYIDFGRVTPARQHEVYRMLLLHALNPAPAHRAVMGLDAGSERIVLVARIRFDDTLSGQRLAAILARLVRQADVWRMPKATPPAIRVRLGRSGLRRRAS